MNLNVTISVDDVHPQKGWRVLGDKTEQWFRQLNEEFGVKFTLFCPSNYHHEWPISEHKEWVTELNSIDWIELAAHGHFHQTTNSKVYGECEFAEIFDEKIATHRLEQMLFEWSSCNIEPHGFRFPGWVGSRESKLVIDNYFSYVAIHYDHNNGLDWYYAKTFFGHDGIQQHNIDVHNGNMIMLQSHIAGNWNHNVWNEDNYEQLRITLRHLVDNYECQFKTLNECV
jgi:hypothetical protein